MHKNDTLMLVVNKMKVEYQIFEKLKWGGNLFLLIVTVCTILPHKVAAHMLDFYSPYLLFYSG